MIIATFPTEEAMEAAWAALPDTTTPVMTEQHGDYLVTTQLGYPFDQTIEYNPQ